MRDSEGNKVTIIGKSNRHILVLGKTGSGKTYWLLKRLHQIIATGKKVIILDFSGSYIEEMIEEDNPEIVKKMRFVSFKTGKGMVWTNAHVGDESFTEEITDILIKLLKIESIYQIKIIGRAVEKLIKSEKKFAFDELYDTLEDMSKGDKEVQTETDFKNLLHLTSRMFPYKKLEKFCITGDYIEEKAVITVLQLHEFSEQRKKFFTSFLLELIVNEMGLPKEERHCDALILDEFQFLPFGKEDALTRLLRESRRFKFEVILLTQYISTYGSDELNALEQVDNLLVFQPTEKDLEFTAKLVDKRNRSEWEGLLEDFSQGKAVLKGHYRLNDNTKVCDKTIICTVDKVDKTGKE